MTDKLDIGYMLAVWFRQEIIAVRYRKHNCLSLKEVSVKKKLIWVSFPPWVSQLDVNETGMMWDKSGWSRLKQRYFSLKRWFYLCVTILHMHPKLFTKTKWIVKLAELNSTSDKSTQFKLNQIKSGVYGCTWHPSFQTASASLLI